MITPNDLLNNIESIRKQKGEKTTQFYESSGAGRSFPDNLKKGRMPAFDKVLMIAEYAGVSIETLIGKDEPIPIKTTEQHWMQILLDLPDDLRNQMEDYLDFLLWKQNRGSAASQSSAAPE